MLVELEKIPFHPRRIQGPGRPGLRATAGSLQPARPHPLGHGGTRAGGLPRRGLDGRHRLQDACTSSCPEPLQPRPAAEGPRWPAGPRGCSAPTRRGGSGASAPRARAAGGDDARGGGGGGLSRSPLRVGLEFPRRAAGAGVSRRSRTAGPAFAFRREARGLWAEVTEGQAPCRGPGGDAAPDTLLRVFGAFHTFPPPRTAPGFRRGSGRRVGSLCGLAVCWDFFLRGEPPPPLSSPKSCGFPRRRKEVEKVLETAL